MMKRRPFALSIASLLLFCSAASAQTTTVTQGASLAESLAQLTSVLGTGQLGDFFRVSTAVDVATMPLGVSSGVIPSKLDPTTGLEVPTARTFGSSLAERALTAGAGKVNLSVSFTSVTYDRLNKLKLSQMQLTNAESPAPELRQAGLMSLILSAQSTVIHASIGASEKLDISAAIPIVRIKLEGISWSQNAVIRQQANGEVGPDIVRRAAASGVGSGLGDIGVTAKYRLLRFGSAPPPGAPLEPDPGGLALLGTVRLPTGSRENLRGLGINRAMLSFVVSGGKGRIRPHANAGFEWWERGVDMASRGDPTVTLRHQVQYVAGIELEAAPKLTLLLDVLGRHILGGGRVDFNTVTPAERPSLTAARLTALTYARATDHGLRKIDIVPGVKWNLKGKLLLSMSGIVKITDNGLHDVFTPVVGLDLTF